MDTHRWKLAEELFSAASDLPETEQTEYLNRACAGDAVLRSEMESLLKAFRQGRSFLEFQPERVGPYRIVEEIGQGGMGQVFRGRRDDGQFDRDVAIKLLRPFPSTALLRRFVGERRILASLSHPNIAQLLDAGVLDSGAPYIVMELVDGVPVTGYCQGRSIAERLRVFRAICAAVHYAHQKLVVHRDLKPGNVIVDAGGVPKLLDFGIAKLLDPAAGDATTVLAALTPDYASPEQARGEPVTTASDVYSLGVLLYEMLTGRLPLNLSGKSLGEVARILEQEPPAPAATGSADLDAILAKALRKNPGERYTSAEAFSHDVRRFLERRPIEARQPGAVYVLGRFVVRHRAALGLLAGVALIVAGALAAMIRESRIAQRRFATVRQLASSSLFEIHDAVQSLPGSAGSRRLIVARALEALDRLRQDAGGDADLQLELAEAYRRLGDVQGLPSQANLGDGEGALASYRHSRELFADALRPRAATFEAVRGLARAERNAALVLIYRGAAAEARQVAAQAMARLEGSIPPGVPVEEWNAERARTYQALADLTDNPEARRHTALEIFERLLAAHPADPSWQRNVALAHKYLATLYLGSDAGDRALPHLRRALELDSARAGANARDREAQFDLSFDHSQYGTWCLNRNRFAEAIQHYRAALAVRRKLAADEPSDARVRDRLAFLLRRTGATLYLAKRPLESLTALQEALQLSEALKAADSGNIGLSRDIAETHMLIARSAAGIGRTAQACSAAHSARAIAAQAQNRAPDSEQENLLAWTEKLVAGCPR